MAVAEAFMACLTMVALLLAMLSALIFSSAFRALRMLSTGVLGRPRELKIVPVEADLSGIS